MPDLQGLLVPDESSHARRGLGWKPGLKRSFRRAPGQAPYAHPPSWKTIRDPGETSVHRSSVRGRVAIT